MRKNRWIWIIIILLLIASFPGLLQRSTTERENNTFELAVPFQEIDQLSTANDEWNVDDVLSSLKEAGLTTVSITPFSLKWMEQEGIVSIYSDKALQQVLRFNETMTDIKSEDQGYYITEPKNEYYEEIIEETFHPKVRSIGDESLFFIKEDSQALSRSLGYNQETIKQIQQHELNIIYRMENQEGLTEGSISQLVDLHDETASGVLFTGNEVVGYPNINLVKTWSDQLTEVGYPFYFIEFNMQRGMQTLARDTDYNTVRMHSIHLNNKTLPENIDQAVRAVKERNIRSLFFHLQTVEPKETLDNAVQFITAVNTKLDPQFQSGTPTPFQKIDTPWWTIALLLAAGILFTYIVAELMKWKKIQWWAAIFMTLIAIGYFITQKLLLLQAFALLIAMATPIYAILTTRKMRDAKMLTISLHYGKALGISVIGILIIVGLLNGNAFITGFEAFRGVKLVYLVPLVFTVGYLFWKEGFQLLQVNVKYWHMLLIVLLGAIGFYYITRTGNHSTVSEIELMARSFLEELLYVRPRTKEFLIGFPFYILALYVIRHNTFIGKLLLIPGIIGFLSIVNTFTHLHIPLHISLLRTGYSILIGYFIGVLLIFLLNIGTPLIHRLLEKRSV
ncbi:DUF5693 family protein [Oceanobacillus picturae]|uniref:DUF5693 family protein n=1 Tax=Oceanobacillus picturae TaxID=171693 RepID=UPI000E67A926|nr:DUF5693 family protein [Oceanobacillus picturae]RIU94920.1 hypothetical protein D1864_03875 [Oceanobacillus picturae]